MREAKAWPCLDCRTLMEWQADGHQRCPLCGVTVWYPDDDKRPEEAIKRLRQDQRSFLASGQEVISRAYVPGTCPPGGGDTTGKTKTEAMKKPGCQHIYQQLFKQT